MLLLCTVLFPALALITIQVPRLPTLDMGYVHISPEYYISSNNHAAPTISDVNTYEGNSSLDGNAKWGLVVDIAAHLWYLGDISACE